MEKQWIKLSTVNNLAEAEMIKGMLNENGIECNILNKEDSSFLIGYIHLFVEKENEQLAKDLINGENQP